MLVVKDMLDHLGIQDHKVSLVVKDIPAVVATPVVEHLLEAKVLDLLVVKVLLVVLVTPVVVGLMDQLAT